MVGSYERGERIFGLSKNKKFSNQLSNYKLLTEDLYYGMSWFVKTGLRPNKTEMIQKQ